MIRFGRALHFVLIFAPVLSGCGTTRLDQTSDSMLQRRAQYTQTYLDESRELYTALLQRIKADLDAH